MVLLYWHIGAAVVALNALAAPLSTNKPLPLLPNTKPTWKSRLLKLAKAAKAEVSTYPTKNIAAAVAVLGSIAVGTTSLYHAYNPSPRRDVTELEDLVYRLEFEDELD